MITKISINQVTSYQSPSSFTIKENINLMYGLNGSDKTTIANYLEDIQNSSYQECDVEGFSESTQKILVYNRHYINKGNYIVEFP